MTDDRQDRNGVRTPVDVERRHKLGLIEKTAKEVGEIKEIDANFSSTSTRALQNKIITTTVNRLFNEKVDKVSGMTLSHNDYTDNDKYKVNNLDGHVHNNIVLLNSLTSEKISSWDASLCEVYSTEEHITNKIWLDGKHIYAKTYTAVVENTGQHSLTLSTDVEQITHIEGFGYNNQFNHVPINFKNDSSNYNQYGFAFNNPVRIEYWTQTNNINVAITLEYTKTEVG